MLEPPATPAVAYLTGRYPAISHTFVAREVDALRALGFDVHTCSVWRTADAELLTGADRRRRDETFALLPLAPVRTAIAHARAALSAPRRYVQTARTAFRIGRPGLRGRALAALWFLEAGALHAHCRRLGARHLHAHLNGTAPTVACLTAELGGPEWSWSMTVHGPSEFFDVHGEALAEKVRRARFVVAISDFARSQLMALVAEEHWDKIAIVHCGVDANVFACPARSPDPDGRLRVLNVARLADMKGQGVLLEAVAELARRDVAVHATLVGDGPRRAELEAMAARLGIGAQVTFAGNVGQDAIGRYYREADVFCSTSFAEGVPVVLMEAGAMGLPVVAPAIMGIPELVEHGVTGLLTPPARPDHVADALERLAADPLEGERMGQAARERVAEHFDCVSEATRLAALLLGGRPGARRTPAAESRLPAR
jgi:glycosyltransferase involved in cell wall biosynthesis